MLYLTFCFVFAARNSPPSDTSRGGQTTKPLQTKGRPMKRRQVKGRPMKGRRVKSQSYTIGLFRNAALANFASH
jgi:hypothetical protein